MSDLIRKLERSALTQEPPTRGYTLRAIQRIEELEAEVLQQKADWMISKRKIVELEKIAVLYENSRGHLSATNKVVDHECE